MHCDVHVTGTYIYLEILKNGNLEIHVHVYLIISILLKY